MQQHQRCVCPQCGTTLRVKDRAYFNRPVPCPDCRSLLVIVALADDTLEARLAENSAADPRELPRPAATRSNLAGKSPDWTPNVVAVSWLAALLVAISIAGVAFWPKSTRRLPVVEVNSEPVRTEPTAVSVDVPPVELPVDEPQFPVAKLIPDQPVEPLIMPESVVDDPEFPPADAALVAAAEVVMELPPEKSLPRIDLETALAQPLLEFRQIRAVPRTELLELLEEMLGAPIRYGREELGTSANLLDQSISFDLQNIHVADVLAKVLEGTDLTSEREPDGLRLRRIAVEPSQPPNSPAP